MPVPLTTAFVAAGAVFLPVSEVAGACLAGVGLLNQLLLVVATGMGYGADEPANRDVIDTGEPEY